MSVAQEMVVVCIEIQKRQLSKNYCVFLRLMQEIL